MSNFIAGVFANKLASRISITNDTYYILSIVIISYAFCLSIYYGLCTIQLRCHHINSGDFCCPDQFRCNGRQPVVRSPEQGVGHRCRNGADTLWRRYGEAVLRRDEMPHLAHSPNQSRITEQSRASLPNWRSARRCWSHHRPSCQHRRLPPSTGWSACWSQRPSQGGGMADHARGFHVKVFQPGCQG